MVDLPFPADATYLRVREIATYLRIDVKTVRRWIIAKALPATRVGRDWRVHRADLKAYLLANGGEAIAHVL
ncbi:MAG: binding domain protein [Cypionkella sp.]|uniref:helix-turn-helix domain-containing protein n=1 Tax=Cypionkella sp. TaxID=2811411 RepID=UPI002612ACCE|nr:helix-turn-helix domain-containing protein [Cypionkella sp.]MDB5660498.1 binding domain protein [Cypionkella sp.]